MHLSAVSCTLRPSLVQVLWSNPNLFFDLILVSELDDLVLFNVVVVLAEVKVAGKATCDDGAEAHNQSAEPKTLDCFKVC